MKYGQQLERESVPEWSLHNLDYNSLKYEIKAHTTKDGAAAMAIPGHPDQDLHKFEDDLYTELDRQHCRLQLFINSKADEVSRRLDHLDSNVQRWIRKGAAGDDASMSLIRQRRFARYERELLRCSHDVLALSRFANAQVVAFRKILKKFRKWTGSSTLTSRFTEMVLGNPKSFTKRDFMPLQARCDDMLGDLRASAPCFRKPSSPSSVELEPPSPPRSPSASDRLPVADMEPRIKYWNEYDDGSDDNEPEDEYAIYINPDDEADFPGLAYFRAITKGPYEKAKQWFERRKSGDETRPLLSSAHTRPRYSSPAIESEEEGYFSSDAIPQHGYSTYLALPSTSEQKMARYREKMLLRGTAGCFATSFVLLAVAATLICTGKRRLRAEVDAGVTLGAMVSLLCACTGLGMTLCRKDTLDTSYRLVVWGGFVASCLLNGMLLVMVLGSTP